MQRGETAQGTRRARTADSATALLPESGAQHGVAGSLEAFPALGFLWIGVPFHPVPKVCSWPAPGQLQTCAPDGPCCHISGSWRLQRHDPLSPGTDCSAGSCPGGPHTMWSLFVPIYSGASGTKAALTPSRVNWELGPGLLEGALPCSGQRKARQISERPIHTNLGV